MKINYNTSIDYRLFVPDLQGNNYIEFSKFGVKFPVDLIYSVNIDYFGDQVIFWMYFTVPDVEHYYNTLKGNSIHAVLYIGNVKYFFEGVLTIAQKMRNMKKNTTELKAHLTIINASKIRENVREEIEISRLDMMDIEDD